MHYYIQCDLRFYRSHSPSLEFQSLAANTSGTTLDIAFHICSICSFRPQRAGGQCERFHHIKLKLPGKKTKQNLNLLNLVLVLSDIVVIWDWRCCLFLLANQHYFWLVSHKLVSLELVSWNSKSQWISALSFMTTFGHVFHWDSEFCNP